MVPGDVHGLLANGVLVPKMGLVLVFGDPRGGWGWGEHHGLTWITAPGAVQVGAGQCLTAMACA